jgi:hypothetical protein
MQVKCSKCAHPILLTDIIESADGWLAHLDCSRPNGLTPNERALLFLYCFNHAVARCLSCDVSFRFTELAADPLGGRTNLCPRCRQDLTEHVRAHLYRCTLVPTDVRLAAQRVREAAQRLVKQSQQLRDKSDVMMRETEAALKASQLVLQTAMARRAAS